MAIFDNSINTNKVQIYSHNTHHIIKYVFNTRYDNGIKDNVQEWLNNQKLAYYCDAYDYKNRYNNKKYLYHPELCRCPLFYNWYFTNKSDMILFKLTFG